MKVTDKTPIADVFYGKFETPKKRNRASKLIPSIIIERLEDGQFTSAMLRELEAEFPLFRYKTCVTIHGIWPEDCQPRLGGYKSVIRNQNGSCEVRWPAIDFEAKLRAGKLLRTIASKPKWSFCHDSNSTVFQSISTIASQADLDRLKAHYLAVRDRIAAVDFYGKFNLWTGSYYGQLILVCEVVPMTLPETAVRPLVRALHGVTDKEIDDAVAADAAKKAADKRYWNDVCAKNAETSARQKRECEAAMTSLANAGCKPVGDLNPGDVLVSVYFDKTDKLIYRFRRIDRFGPFKLIFTSNLHSDTPELPENPAWRPAVKGMKRDDVLRTVPGAAWLKWGTKRASSVTVTRNREQNGIELKFAAFPGKPMAEKLKNRGFKWHWRKRVWYAKDTAENLQFAHTL